MCTCSNRLHMNDSRSNFINLHRVWLRLLEKCTWKLSLTRIARWSVIIFYLPHYVWIKKNYDIWPIEKWFFIQHIFSMLARSSYWNKVYKTEILKMRILFLKRMKKLILNKIFFYFFSENNMESSWGRSKSLSAKRENTCKYHKYFLIRKKTVLRMYWIFGFNNEEAHENVLIKFVYLLYCNCDIKWVKRLFPQILS